jgi:dienelactone hydrolase
VVLVLHGFKGFRNWGFLPWLSARIADRGMVAITPDFSHNGTGPDGAAYPRKDLFEASTWATHQEDLRILIDAARAGTLPGTGPVAPERVGILGHSLGGGLAILRARDDRTIAAVVGWAPVAKADRFSPAEKARWRRLGRLPIINTRTGEELPLGLGFLDDAEARAAELDVARAATSLGCPLLVVHGTEDTSVPSAEGRALVESAMAAGRPARYRELRGTQHTFDAVHPFQGPTPALEEATAETLAFLETYLVRFDPQLLAAIRGGR